MDNNGAMGPVSEGVQEETKGSETKNTLYRGYLKFEQDNESYEKNLSELCPLAASFNKNPNQSAVNMITVFETLLKRLVDTKLNNYQQLVLVTALRRLISN